VTLRPGAGPWVWSAVLHLTLVALVATLVGTTAAPAPAPLRMRLIRSGPAPAAGPAGPAADR